MEKWKEIMTKKEKQLPGGCSCMTLTSISGKPYWFRTCDVEFDLRKEGAHPVLIEKGKLLEYEGRGQRKSEFGIIGITYNKKETWLLDGMNEKGLCGGLLMLSEGRGRDKREGEKQEIMAMEAVCYFLSCCKNVREVRKEAEEIYITNIYCEGSSFPATVHYYFLDESGDEVILEPVIEAEPGRLKIYERESSLGVMTNSPVYEAQKENLSWFLSQSAELKNIKKEGEDICLEFEGRILKADNKAPHLSVNGGFPGSFASYDRFIRLAVLKALNNSGRDFPDEKMIPLGVGIMNVVREPFNQGLLHYSFLDLKEDGEKKIVGRKNSRTEYLVVYDPATQRFYLSWFDELEWTCYTLK